MGWWDALYLQFQFKFLNYQRVLIFLLLIKYFDIDWVLGSRCKIRCYNRIYSRCCSVTCCDWHIFEQFIDINFDSHYKLLVK